MTWTTDNPAIVETWGLRGSFQARAIDALAVAPRGILIAPAGSGKTIMLARSIETILRSLPDGQALRLLWLANTRDQLDQAKKALELLATLRSRFSGWVRTPAGCTEIPLPSVDVLIVDECFPSGTLIDGRPIETIRVGDEVSAFDHRIEKIVKARVRATMRRSAPKSLVKITTSLGRQFICTENHPVFLPELYCYRPAATLKCGDMVLTYNPEQNHGKNQKCKMQGVRGDLFCVMRPLDMLKGVRAHYSVEAQKAGRDPLVPRMRNSRLLRYKNSSRCVEARKSILLGRLQEGVLCASVFVDDVSNKFDLRLRENEESESHEARGCSEEGFNQAPRDGMGAASEGWKWQGADEVAIAIGMRARLENGVYNRNRATYIRIREAFAESLQDRCRVSGTENSDRGGWEQPQHNQCPRERSAQGCFSFADRVESIEVLESGDRQELGRLCPDGFVYNLEVEDHNNYFANGVLVHNCHHAAAASWAAVIRSCVNARTVWGMTATGHREDGEWPAVEEIIGPVVCEITKAEVAGDGFSVPARIEWIVPGQLDQHTEAVRSLAEDGDPSRFETMLRKCRWSMIKQGKDYAQVAEEVRARVTYQAAVELVISENRLRNDLAAHHCYQAVLWGESVLCLVYSVEQCEYIAAAVGGALVHSKLGKKLRRERIAAFRDGTVKCLVSTSLADEGLDVPIASTLVMACGGRGMSKALGTDGKKRTTAKIEQRTARVLRPVPGKDEARIVDFFDWQHPMMLGASWTRRKGYAELGFRQRVPAEIVGQRRPAPAGREGDLFQ